MDPISDANSFASVGSRFRFAVTRSSLPPIAMAAVVTFDSQAVNQALRRLQEGDRSVAHTVFAALWPIVSSFCRSALGDASQDAAQETLMRIFQQAHQFRPGGDAVAWALEIATWECRTELRRRGRELAAPLKNAEAIETGTEVMAGLEKEQLAAAVRASIAHLAPRDQALVTSVLDETFPPSSGPAARKRKERALTRFKQAWRSLYGFE